MGDNMKIVFDFETYDPELMEAGSGYPWGNIEIIGMGYKIDSSPTKYTTDINEMVQLLTESQVWVAHNISYELGIAKFLGVDFKDKEIYCTMTASMLEDNSRMSHSLDILGKKLLKKHKDTSRFGRLVLEQGIVLGDVVISYPKKYDKMKALEEPTKEDLEYMAKTEKKVLAKATKLAMGRLDIIQVEDPDIIEEYCKNDVDLTYELDQHFMDVLDMNHYNTFSSVHKVLIEMRHKGVKVDLEAAKASGDQLDKLLETLRERLENIYPGLNINSNKQLTKAFTELKIPLPMAMSKAKGELTPSFKKDTLEPLVGTHDIYEIILGIRKYGKARNEFIENIFKFQHDGRIHGQMRLFGAARTGRFSHKTPNLAQIPSRDPVIGPMMRSIFIADEGEDWYSLDFSAQEPRIMVHYGILCQENKVKFKKEVYDNKIKGWKSEKTFRTYDVPSVLALQQAYIDNPALDSHTYNMDIINNTTGVGISRTDTKAIALGKAYGMGLSKLAISLKITDDKAKELATAFDTGSPFLSELDAFCKYKMRTNGKIKTIGGRVSKSDGADYKALNKLVQGSAADQTALSILMMYNDYGIIPSIVVHDEVNFSGTPWQAEIVKKCMENAVKLEIPSLSEIGVGKNWSEAK
jgi:DNA polymerase I-like protein with 3'-5' exonuclease and polymerase domains